MSAPRSRTWRWGVCLLLLLATTINYMDRLTLSTAAARIKADLSVDNEQYGRLEFSFGMAFALGSLVFGWLADHRSVRWLYPLVLTAWSVAGFATGLVQDYAGLLACRTALGFFEAGHWPCGLRTVQLIHEPGDRTMGNSLLQGGASIGAIITPQVMRMMMTPETGSWRAPFMLLGAAGLGWIVLWLASIRRDDLAAPAASERSEPTDAPPFRKILTGPRFLSLACMVVLISLCWQLFRAWLPLFLQEGRGYTEKDALNFTTFYYIAAEIGVLSGGALSLLLRRAGLSVHGARCGVFLLCSLLTLLTTAVALLPKGPLLLAALLAVAFGALGVFPCYYSFTQELSVRSMGKVTGALGCISWVIPSAAQWWFGAVVRRTGSYDLGIGLCGWAPILSLLILWALWHREPDRRTA
jgi:ACS family hexuronate transporter-like MFS transporter